jgi:hypothetical protein
MPYKNKEDKYAWNRKQWARKGKSPEYRATRKAWEAKNKDVICYHSAKRRAAKLQRTPSWADELVIQMIYEDCPEGHHVDHIYPLQGENVSGLHVAWNLQYLTPEENMSKGNRYE